MTANAIVKEQHPGALTAEEAWSECQIFVLLCYYANATTPTADGGKVKHPLLYNSARQKFEVKYGK